MSGTQPIPANHPCFWDDQLVEALTGVEYEARDAPRTKLTAEIAVRSTNGRGSVFGTPYAVISTDISATGMGFLHRAIVADRFLALSLGQGGEPFFVLAEVVRCRCVGNLFEVGVKFLRKLESIDS